MNLCSCEMYSAPLHYLAVLYPALHAAAEIPGPDDGGWGTDRLPGMAIPYCDIPQVDAANLPAATFFRDYYAPVSPPLIYGLFV